MLIHKFEKNDNLGAIAERYFTNEEIIRKHNQLDKLPPAVGEEILVLTPTRTYTAKYGDSLDGIGLRFSIPKKDMEAMNPGLVGKELRPGDVIAIKCCDRPYGMSVANGYCYKDCTSEKLIEALPYLTYVTFSSVTADIGGFKRIFNDDALLEIAKQAGKIPLLRVFDKYDKRYAGEDTDSFISKLVNLAKEKEYKGIVLNACSMNEIPEKYTEFIVNLRGAMLGCDLILLTEINEESPIEFSEYADASIMYYPKFAKSPETSFDDGEAKFLSDFAAKGESARTFIDLPSVAMLGNEYVGMNDAINLARRGRCQTSINENTLLSHFRCKQGEGCYTSLTGIGKILGLINEFDYMGVCFDVMRSPRSHFSLYNALFKSYNQATIRSVEGCSRGRGE